MMPPKLCLLMLPGDRSKGTAKPIRFGTNSVAGVARTMLKAAADRLRDSSSGFFMRLTPLAFPVVEYPARQRRFVIKVFLPLGELPSTAEEPHLPQATGFKAPDIRLPPSPLFLSVEAVPPRAGHELDYRLTELVPQRLHKHLIINYHLIFFLHAGYPNLQAYTCSKFALEGFTESLAVELRPYNIWLVMGFLYSNV